MDKEYKNPIATLLHWAGRERYWLCLSVVLAVVSGLCTMIPYMGIYQLMDAAISGQITYEIIWENAVLIAVAILARFTLFGCSIAASHKGAYGALFKVRCMVTEHMARVPLGALDEQSTGNMKTVLNEDIEKLELFLAHNLPELIYYLIGPVTVFAYLLTVNPILALISLLPLALAMVVTAISFRNSDQMMGKINGSIMSLNSVMIEYISGMKLIKAYNMGSKSFRKFSRTIEEENTVWNELSKKLGPPYAAFIVIIECGMLFMVPVGGMFLLKDSITASVFLLFAFVGSLYFSEIRPLRDLGNNFAEVLKSVDKVKEILAVPIFEGSCKFPDDHSIQLEDVRFAYPASNSGTNVLDHCNIQIQSGEKVGLVGCSGAGKTTVIQLIARFYDVQSGEVLIGGQNVKDIDYEALLQNISIVFQKTFLTRDSVMENIRMGTDASLEEVRTAAKKAQIDEFIMTLPNGYETKVGSYGTRFSGGEKQRIAIARAILKNAPILILDEATSAADPENQVEIDRAIENLCKGKTVIIVAHRLGAIRMCDKVAVIENHTITSFGTHDEVRKENTYYQQAWADYERARAISYQLEGGEHNERNESISEK